MTTAPSKGSPAAATQAEAPPSAASPADGCQYIKGLQFEGQLSALDDGEFRLLTAAEIISVNYR